MTPRQTIRLSGVISCARHEELGQRLAVNSFTVVLAQVQQSRPVKVNDFSSPRLSVSAAQPPLYGQIY